MTLGMLCAGAGVELLLRGALGLSAWMRLPAALVRAVLVLLLYAGAEFAVVIESSRIQRPDLALGAALGTSIVHLGLVLSIALLRTSLTSRSAEDASDAQDLIDARRRPEAVRNDARPRDCILATVAPLVVAFFARDGAVSRTEGCFLLGLWLCWLSTAVWEAWLTAAPTSGTDEQAVERRGWLAVSFCFVGLLLLASTGRLLVSGAEGLVNEFQLDYFTLGATLVPLCIAVPALTSPYSTKYRPARGVSTARLLDGCILNAWLLAGIAAAMASFRVSAMPVSIAAACAALLALFTWPTDRVPNHVRGVLLAAIYAGFLWYML